MRTFKGLPCLALLAASALISEPARAGDPKEPPQLGDTLRGPAREAYLKGKERVKHADFVEAIVAFERSYELCGDARLFWNIAHAEQSLGHYAAAVRWIERYLAEVRVPLPDERRLLARRVIRDLRAHTAELQLVGLPAGAQVYVNDLLLGSTPLGDAVLIDEGTAHLLVNAAGFDSYAQTLKVTAEKPVKVSITLKKDDSVKLQPGGAPLSSAPRPPTATTPPETAKEATPLLNAESVNSASTIPNTARLSITTREPNAAIQLDGQLKGRGTWYGAVASGKHKLTVSLPGKQRYAQELNLAAGSSRSLAVQLEDEPAMESPVWPWVVGAGVLVAGLGVGGYFLFRETPNPGPRQPGGNIGNDHP